MKRSVTITWINAFSSDSSFERGTHSNRSFSLAHTNTIRYAMDALTNFDSIIRKNKDENERNAQQSQVDNFICIYSQFAIASHLFIRLWHWWALWSTIKWITFYEWRIFCPFNRCFFFLLSLSTTTDELLITHNSAVKIPVAYGLEDTKFKLNYKR